MTTEPAEITFPPSLILAQTHFFRDLSERQIEQVCALSELLHFEAGRQIYRISEPAHSLYVLVSGSVRQSVGLGDRLARTGDILRRGEIFGWAALTPSCSLRIATTSCLSACSVLAIDGAGLLRLMEQDHTMGYRLMTQLNRLVTGTLTAFAGG